MSPLNGYREQTRYSKGLQQIRRVNVESQALRQMSECVYICFSSIHIGFIYTHFIVDLCPQSLLIYLSGKSIEKRTQNPFQNSSNPSRILQGMNQRITTKSEMDLNKQMGVALQRASSCLVLCSLDSQHLHLWDQARGFLKCKFQILEKKHLHPVKSLGLQALLNVWFICVVLGPGAFTLATNQALLRCSRH